MAAALDRTSELASLTATFLDLSAKIAASTAHECRYSHQLTPRLVLLDGVFARIQACVLGQTPDETVVDALEDAAAACVCRIRLFKEHLDGRLEGCSRDGLEPDLGLGADEGKILDAHSTALVKCVDLVETGDGGDTVTSKRSAVRRIIEELLRYLEAGVGAGHEETQCATRQLAALDVAVSEYDGARETLETLLRAQSSQSPERRAGFMKTVAQLANVYRLTDRFSLALRCYETCLMESVTQLGSHHPDTIAWLEGLAVVYRNVYRVDEATALYEQVIRFQEKAVGWSHPNAIRAAINCGIAMMYRREYDEAVDLFLKAAEGVEGLLGPEHADAVWTKELLSDARQVRDQRFSRVVFHFSLRSAAYFAERHRMKLEAGQGKSIKGDGPAREVVDVHLKPQPSWKPLRTVFDAKGAGNIQAAAVHKDWEGPVFSHDAKLNVRDHEVADIVQQSMAYTYSELLDLLEQSYGLSVNEVDTKGFTQLARAAQQGDIARVRTLLSRTGIDADKGYHLPLKVACQARHEDIVAALLAHQPTVDVNGHNWQSTKASILMETLDIHDPTPDLQSCSLRIVKLLLSTKRVHITYQQERGPNREIESALTLALRNKHIDAAKLILDEFLNNPSWNDKETHSVLSLAATLGEIPFIQHLLAKTGTSVSTPGWNGVTPLHNVSDPDTCRFLLGLGAAVDAKTTGKGSYYDQGQTPLHFASRSRNEHVAAVLLEAGADPNAKDEEGRTPLHLAMTAAAVRVLMEGGADAGVRNGKGKTALFGAVEEGNWGVVRALLEGEREAAGVDVPAEDGKTPLGLAFAVGDEEGMRVLVGAGARVDVEGLRGMEMVGGKSREELLSLLSRIVQGG